MYQIAAVFRPVPVETKQPFSCFSCAISPSKQGLKIQEWSLNPGLILFSGKPIISNQKLITFQCHSIADGVRLRLSTGSIHQTKTIFCISFLEVVLHGGLFHVTEWLCKSIPEAGKTSGEHNDPGDGYHFHV